MNKNILITILAVLSISAFAQQLRLPVENTLSNPVVNCMAVDDDGYLYITGRQKSVIVLENGKNVFPEEIEEYLSHIEQIAECVVVGRGRENVRIELTAIVYPDMTKFPENTDEDTVRRSLEHSIVAMNKKLPSFKRVMRIELKNTEFEKTSARKIKRHLVK